MTCFLVGQSPPPYLIGEIWTLSYDVLIECTFRNVTPRNALAAANASQTFPKLKMPLNYLNHNELGRYIGNNFIHF